jgi:outer membrane immunogenic protein
MRNTVKLATAVLMSTTMLGGAAFAGSLEDAVVEAPVYTPAPEPVALGGDWTGFYTGLQLGYADIDGDDGALPDDENGDGMTYGLHAGYDYDFGQYVLGAELDYDKADFALDDGTEVDSIARLKMKAGYDMGRTLVYLTAGAAQIDTAAGDETGAFGGVGANYQVTDSFTVGSELLYHKFDDIGGTGVEADATTFNVRGSFRF